MDKMVNFIHLNILWVGSMCTHRGRTPAGRYTPPPRCRSRSEPSRSSCSSPSSRRWRCCSRRAWRRTAAWRDRDRVFRWWSPSHSSSSERDGAETWAIKQRLELLSSKSHWRDGGTCTYQMATQTSSLSMQIDVMEQLDLQVPVPPHGDGSRSQNLQSCLQG